MVYLDIFKYLIYQTMLSLLIFSFVSCALVFQFGQAEVLPDLLISGFAWAENLVFDGFGSLFVAESVRGELWRINLCEDGKNYCSKIQLTDGLKAVGGMQIPPDGKTIYAGATLDDGSYVVITTPANPEGAANFTVIASTIKQPNGVACDWATNTLYYTMEGDRSLSGALMKVDLATGEESTAYGNINGADGAWFDRDTNLLYVGLLTEMKVLVFNVSNPVSSPSFLFGEFPALGASLDKKHMLDDLTLFQPSSTTNFGAETILLGADWLGSQLQKFNLDGTTVSSIPPPAGVDSFYQLTSVRWGKGPGFDPNSIYVTEGGGIQPHQTDRRVMQIKMNA
jgi:hypothetical protein